MFSIPSETYQTVWQIARFPLGAGVALLAFSAMIWLHGEKKDRKALLRAAPSAGTVGELVVITGSDELPAQTWFPVPREGVLGAVRSCDLVIPGAGIHAQHLDFTWLDGVGLLIRPRNGCKVRVNDTELDCRSDPASAPLTHGSSLQIGSAVLRLHLFAALDSVSASRSVPDAEGSPAVPPAYPESVPGSFPGPSCPVLPYPEPFSAVQPLPGAPYAVPPYPETPSAVQPPPGTPFAVSPYPAGQPLPGPPYTVSPYPETYPAVQAVPAVPTAFPPYPVYPSADQAAAVSAAGQPVVSPPDGIPPSFQAAPSAVPQPADGPDAPVRPRRGNRWKEDWGE